MTTFIISNIHVGGSEKYIKDLMSHYSGIKVIKNKNELLSISFTEKDTVMIQQLFFTGISPADLINIKRKFSVRFIISIHDFCWFSDTEYESIYLNPNLFVPFDVARLFSLADYVIHPSYFTKEVYERAIPHRAIVQPHNDIVLHGNTKTIRPLQDEIVIGVPHAFSDYKGKENVHYLIEYTEYKGFKLKFAVAGVNVPGYTEDNYADFYKTVHCLLHLNKWGETYCYTLTKSINSGLPILYNNVGAFKERIPPAEHYFKAIEHESDYYDRDKLRKAFESMLDYIIENNGKYDTTYYNTPILYHDFYDYLFEPRIPYHILLTSTVNVNKNKICLYQTDNTQRKDAYLKSIKNWISFTKFYITVIENSDYDFPELKQIIDQYSYRFEYIKYNEAIYKYVYNISSKGVSELCAINHALMHSTFLKSAKFIIKITARYYIPELESFLNTINLNAYECLVQHDIDRCEMVGARHDCFDTVFKFTKEIDHIEDYYKNTAATLKTLKCKKFFIEPTQRGGANELYISI